MSVVNRKSNQGGSYVEILIAAAILAVAIPSIMEGFGVSAATDVEIRVQLEAQGTLHTRMIDVTSLPFSKLLAAAAAAKNKNTPTAFSDPSGTPARKIVYIARYDGDGTPFNVADPNYDGDGNKFTDYDGLLWVHVTYEDGTAALSTLVAGGT